MRSRNRSCSSSSAALDLGTRHGKRRAVQLDGQPRVEQRRDALRLARANDRGQHAPARGGQLPERERDGGLDVRTSGRRVRASASVAWSRSAFQNAAIVACSNMPRSCGDNPDGACGHGSTRNRWRATALNGQSLCAATMPDPPGAVAPGASGGARSSCDDSSQPAAGDGVRPGRGRLRRRCKLGIVEQQCRGRPRQIVRRRRRC